MRVGVWVCRNVGVSMDMNVGVGGNIGVYWCVSADRFSQYLSTAIASQLATGGRKPTAAR